VRLGNPRSICIYFRRHTNSIILYLCRGLKETVYKHRTGWNSSNTLLCRLQLQIALKLTLLIFLQYHWATVMIIPCTRIYLPYSQASLLIRHNITSVVETESLNKLRLNTSDLQPENTWIKPLSMSDYPDRFSSVPPAVRCDSTLISVKSFSCDISPNLCHSKHDLSQYSSRGLLGYDTV
jgi:hypothetical protein